MFSCLHNSNTIKRLSASNYVSTTYAYPFVLLLSSRGMWWVSTLPHLLKIFSRTFVSFTSFEESVTGILSTIMTFSIWNASNWLAWNNPFLAKLLKCSMKMKKMCGAIYGDLTNKNQTTTYTHPHIQKPHQMTRYLKLKFKK